MTSFRDGRNLILLNLNDGEQTMLNLFFFIYMKQTSLICQYLIKNPKFPYEEIMRTILSPGYQPGSDGFLPAERFRILSRNPDFS
jgi:hypothetical protein